MACRLIQPHAKSMSHQKLNKTLVANWTTYFASVALALTVAIRYFNFENITSLERENIGVKILLLGSVSSFFFAFLFAHARLMVRLMMIVPTSHKSSESTVKPQVFSGWRALGIGWLTFFLVQAITQPLYLVTKVPVPGGLNPTTPGFLFTLFNYGVLTPLLETILQSAAALVFIKFVKNTYAVAFFVGILAALAHGYAVPYWWIAGFVVFFCTTIIFLSQTQRRRGAMLAFLAHAANNICGLAFLVGLWYINQ